MNFFDITVLVTFAAVALLLSLARINALVSLGLPGVVGIWVVNGSLTGTEVGSSMLLTFHSYIFATLALWIITSNICVESGIFARCRAALALLFGRNISASNRFVNAAGRGKNQDMGYFTTAIILLLVACMSNFADNNLATLFAFIPMSIFTLIVFLYFLFSMPRFSTVKFSRVVSDSSGKGRKIALHSAVAGPDGSLFKITGRAGAFITLLPMIFISTIFMSMTLLLPIGISDIAAPTFILVLLLALAAGQKFSWVQAAAYNSWRDFSQVSTQVLGAVIFATFLSELGVISLLGSTIFESGISPWMVLLGTGVLSGLLGLFFGSYAGVVLSLWLSSRIWLVTEVADASSPYSSSQITIVILLTSMLAVAAAIGGMASRISSWRFEGFSLPL